MIYLLDAEKSHVKIESHNLPVFKSNHDSENCCVRFNSSKHVHTVCLAHGSSSIYLPAVY